MPLDQQMAMIRARGECEVKNGPNPGVYIIHRKGVFQSSRRPECLVVDTRNRTVEHPGKRLKMANILRPLQQIIDQLLR